MTANRARMALASLCLAWVLPAAGQNQILNPDFDVDVNNWTPNSGNTTVSHDADSGVGSPLGAASLEFAASGADGAAMYSNCVLVAPAAKLKFGGLGRLHVDLGGGSISVRVSFYSTTNCASASFLGSHHATPVSQTSGTVDGASGLAFTRYEGGIVSPPAVQSMRVSASFLAGGGIGVHRVLWDRMYLGPPGTTPVELESFGLE